MLWQKNGRIENLIDNLKSINQRIDTGNLWENFIVSERRKQLFCRQQNVRCYFWRTYSGSEVDYVEEGENGLTGYEIKLSKSKIRTPKSWEEEYYADFKLINRSNYLDFLLE